MANLIFILIFYLNTVVLEVKNWKIFSEKVSDVDYKYTDDVSFRKGPIILIIDNAKENYPDTQIRKKMDRYELEPYKTLQLMAAQKKTTEENNDFYQVIEGLPISKTASEMLRAKWFTSCQNKAVKVCKKACKKANKEVCKSFRCNQNMRHRAKSECSKYCKQQFGS